MTFRLGKKPARHDDRTMQFRHFRTELPAPPAAVDYMTEIGYWPMYLNDTLGDCVEAAFAHLQLSWSRYAGKPIIPSNSEVLTAYEAIGGYVPGDPSTDNGSDLLTALKYYRQRGFITAFMQLERGNWLELQQAIAIFGGVYIGIQLPNAVVPQGPGAPDWTDIPWKWEGSMVPNPENGHCVPAMRYLQGADYWNNFISWGQRMGMNQAFYVNCSDEAYAIVTPEWIEANGKSPSGFDLAQLLANLQSVTG
jgi:hypothetical protein